MKKMFVFFILIQCQTIFANELVNKIMSLREEVQLISDEITSLNDELRTKAQSLAIEKGEVLAKKNLLLEEQKILNKTLKEKMEISGKGPEEILGLGSMVKESLEELLVYIKNAVPFKLEEREKSVKDLLSKYEEGGLEQEKFLEKYWSLLQDELRLSSDVELQQQMIEIHGKKKFVEVVRVGMTSLFFRSLDGEIGHAVNEDNKWVFKSFDSSRNKNEVLKLFNAKKKLIEGEVFKLPIYAEKQNIKTDSMSASVETER